MGYIETVTRTWVGGAEKCNYQNGVPAEIGVDKPHLSHVRTSQDEAVPGLSVSIGLVETVDELQLRDAGSRTSSVSKSVACSRYEQTERAGRCP